jgi:hypothetical protein
MDLEHFVTAQDSRGTFRPGDRAATPSCERRLRRRVQSAMRERLEDTRSMINLDGAPQSMAYTEHCLPNDQHRRTTVGKIPTTGACESLLVVVGGSGQRKRSAPCRVKSHSLGIAAEAPNGR